MGDMVKLQQHTGRDAQCVYNRSNKSDGQTTWKTQHTYNSVKSEL